MEIHRTLWGSWVSCTPMKRCVSKPAVYLMAAKNETNGGAGLGSLLAIKDLGSWKHIRQLCIHMVFSQDWGPLQWMDSFLQGSLQMRLTTANAFAIHLGKRYYLSHHPRAKTEWITSQRVDKSPKQTQPKRLPQSLKPACKFAKLCPSTKSLPQTDSKSSLRTSSPPEIPREKSGCFTDLFWVPYNEGTDPINKKYGIRHTLKPLEQRHSPVLKWLGDKMLVPKEVYQFTVLVWPPPGCRQGNTSKLQSPVARRQKLKCWPMRFLFQGQLSFMSLDGSGPKEQTQCATCICIYI